MDRILTHTVDIQYALSAPQIREAASKCNEILLIALLCELFCNYTERNYIQHVLLW